MVDDTDEELVIAKLAERVRGLYCRLRSRTCVQGYSPGPRYDKDWIKVAKWCAVYGIDPREFMEVQFHAMKPYPYISSITTAAAIKRFFDARREYAAEVASKVLIQMASLEKLMAIGRSIRDIMLDTQQDFDPLFKYLVTADAELDDLSSLYWDDALEIYMTSIYYDGIYKELITDDLKEAVRKVRCYADG